MNLSSSDFLNFFAAANVKLLASRDTYRHCHIQLPESDERIAAIVIENDYYSLFRTEQDPQRTVDLALRLQHHHNVVVVTLIPKGFAIWLMETDAQLSPPRSRGWHKSNEEAIQLLKDQIIPRNQYRPCHVRVPDLSDRVAAIEYQSGYYSLLKATDHADEILRVKSRLEKRGDRSVITLTSKGYGIWVLEPEADPPGAW